MSAVFGWQRYFLCVWPFTERGHRFRMRGVINQLTLKPLYNESEGPDMVVGLTFTGTDISLRNSVKEESYPDQQLPQRTTAEELAIAVLSGDNEAAAVLADLVLQEFHAGRTP